jgi:conjugative transfer region protein TrbK
MDRSDPSRIAAIAVLIAVVITDLVAIHRQPIKPVTETPPTTPLGPDDLSAELNRCRTLGPKDAEDPHCMAVWEETRRRFFGRPARPLPPPTTTAPVTTPSGESHG